MFFIHPPPPPPPPIITSTSIIINISIPPLIIISITVLFGGARRDDEEVVGALRKKSWPKPGYGGTTPVWLWWVHPRVVMVGPPHVTSKKEFIFLCAAIHHPSARRVNTLTELVLIFISTCIHT